MAVVAITITLPGGSPVDYTNACVFSRCTFSQNQNAVPGRFDIYVRDPARSLSFVTGSEILLTVDGVALFGGYITQVGMTSFAPAADTTDLSTYTLALWHLSGPDYNIVFDKRVFRNTANYLAQIQINSNVDASILTTAIGTYADMSDFSTAGITAITSQPDTTKVFIQQGWALRKEFETLLAFSGAIYYASPTKVITYVPYEAAVKRWGFSDAPNNVPITVSPDAYQSATYGFREVEGTEDATYLANDILAWGGSWVNSAPTVFDREQDATSISAHGRWQHVESHIGEAYWGSIAQVTLAAQTILDGPAGTGASGLAKGLKNPQWQFTFKWNTDHVPKLSGVPDHIKPGDLVTIDLTVFGVSMLLPLRTLTISFPDASDNATEASRIVEFSGTFGLQLSDSYTLWRYIQQNQGKTPVAATNVVTSSATTTTYGAAYSGVPTPVTDGATTLFTTTFGYISGTLNVWINGLIQRPGVDFTETDNVAGTFTTTSVLVAADDLYVTMSTLGS